MRAILVATDGSERSEKAVDTAVEMAMKFDATLHIVYVVPRGEIPPRILDYLKDERVDGGIGKMSAKVIGEAVLEPVLERVKQSGIRDAKYMVLRGDPAEEILKFAKNREVDMIVLGKRGYSGLKELLLGSVSRKVCHLSECACVTV